MCLISFSLSTVGPEAERLFLVETQRDPLDSVCVVADFLAAAPVTQRNETSARVNNELTSSGILGTISRLVGTCVADTQSSTPNLLSCPSIRTRPACFPVSFLNIDNFF